jgi:hypothetical protein
MYITINEYAKKHGITRQSVYMRIKKGHISQDRLGKDDGGKITIYESDGHGKENN